MTWSHLELTRRTNSTPSSEQYVDVPVPLMKNLHSIEDVLTVEPILYVHLSHQQ
jgi:hypothetical protein